jgi:hypothetical protein
MVALMRRNVVIDKLNDEKDGIVKSFQFAPNIQTLINKNNALEE